MSIRNILGVAMLITAVLLAGPPVRAHHSAVAQFNLEKPVTLRGTLTKMEWTNPHGWIHLDVKGPDGRIESWAIETGSPARMVKRGLKRTDFQPGEDLIVGGFAARDGSRTAAGWVVTFPAREASYPEREATFPLGR